MGRHLSLRYGQVILVSGYPVLTAVNWSQHWCPICVHYQFSCAFKLARKYEIELWSRSSQAINWSADSFQKNTSRRWVDTWAGDMVMWYWSVAILFWQLPIDHFVNAQIQDVDLPRHAWNTPPSLLTVSPTLPLQSVDAYVRTYVRTYAQLITRQPKEKRLTIFHEIWGSVLINKNRSPSNGASISHTCPWSQPFPE